MNRSVYFFLILLITVLSACKRETKAPTSVPATTIPVTQPPALALVTSTPNIVTPTLQTTPMLDQFLQNASFTIQELNPIAPDDILEEITFFAGGGGPGTACTDPEGYPVPRIDFGSPDFLKPGCIYWIDTCGWTENAVIKISLIYPDGQIETLEKIATSVEVYSITRNNFYFLPPNVGYMKTISPSDPMGLYQVVFESERGEKVIDTFVNELVFSPRFYLDGDHFLLVGFMTGEHVRLLVYENRSGEDLYLKGWKSYSVDESGQLRIDIQSYEEYHYVIVGESTGQVDLTLPDLCLGEEEEPKYPSVLR